MTSQCHSVGDREGGGGAQRQRTEWRDFEYSTFQAPAPAPGKETSGSTGLPGTKVIADIPGTHSGRLPGTVGQVVPCTGRQAQGMVRTETRLRARAGGFHPSGLHGGALSPALTVACAPGSVL